MHVLPSQESMCCGTQNSGRLATRARQTCAMMLVCNMMSSMQLGKQSRAVATNPEQSVHQTHAGKHAQMQCATCMWTHCKQTSTMANLSR